MNNSQECFPQNFVREEWRVIKRLKIWKLKIVWFFERAEVFQEDIMQR